MTWTGIVNYLVANWVELAGAATTALGIWLTARRVIWCWPVVLVADVLYIIVYRKVLLLSDAMLQVFFLGFTLYGWWHWWRGLREDGEVRVEPLGRTSMLAGLAAGAVGCVALGAVTVRLGAALPFLDAALASYSLVGSWWQARKHIANWWLWVVVDTIYVGEYIYKNLWPTAVLYAGLVALAIVGLRDWRRAAATNQMAA
jgi:nicotinamide mononucleotide transporter